jgi:hypothetical protein
MDRLESIVTVILMLVGGIAGSMITVDVNDETVYGQEWFESKHVEILAMEHAITTIDGQLIDYEYEINVSMENWNETQVEGYNLIDARRYYVERHHVFISDYNKATMNASEEVAFNESLPAMVEDPH